MSDNDIDHDNLVHRFVDERTLALLLVGSFARGDHGPYSDIDLARYVEADKNHGDLACAIDGKERLITVKTLAVTREERALNDPGKAVWQVPNLRSAVILYDVDCRAARLIAKAHDFSWDGLGGAPDRHVASEVAYYAEEALKIAGGLANGQSGQVLYGTMGMVLALPMRWLFIDVSSSSQRTGCSTLCSALWWIARLGLQHSVSPLASKLLTQRREDTQRWRSTEKPYPSLRRCLTADRALRRRWPFRHRDV